MAAPEAKEKKITAAEAKKIVVAEAKAKKLAEDEAKQAKTLEAIRAQREKDLKKLKQNSDDECINFRKRMRLEH